MYERYEIRVRGFLGPLLRTAVGKLRYRTLPYQSTIRGRLSDAELEHLIDRLDRSGVEMVCLSRMAADSSAGDGVPPPRRQQDRDMTDTESRQTYEDPYVPSGPAQPSRWVGMVVFAGVMLLTLGGFEVIEGTVALFKDGFYLTTRDGLVVPMDFTAWGWTHIGIGLISVVIGLGILYGQMWARVLGIIIAMLSALANLAFLPAYPVWCTIVIAVDVLIIYALSAHGREVSR